MNCDRISSILSAYVDNELDDETKKFVDAHLEICSVCREELDQLRLLVNSCRSLGETEIEPPADLREAIINKIRESDKALCSKQKSRVGLISSLYDITVRYRGLTAVAAVIVFALFLRLLFNFNIGFMRSDFARDILPQSKVGLKQTEQAPAAAPGGGESMSMLMDKALSQPQETTKNDALKSRSFMPESPLSEASANQSSGAAPGLGIAATDSLGYDRMLVKRANYTLEVPKGECSATTNKVVSIAEGSGGYVQSVSSWSEGINQVSNMAIRVPASSFNTFLQKIESAGKVVSRSIETQDVTEEVIDLEARIKNKEAQERRLVQILGDAKTVGEILQVENELNRIRTEMESMVQKLKYYQNVTSMSSAVLTIREEGTYPGRPVRSTFWGTVWASFVLAMENMLVGLAKVFPYLILAGLIYFGYFKFKNR